MTANAITATSPIFIISSPKLSAGDDAVRNTSPCLPTPAELNARIKAKYLYLRKYLPSLRQYHALSLACDYVYSELHPTPRRRRGYRRKGVQLNAPTAE